MNKAIVIISTMVLLASCGDGQIKNDPSFKKRAKALVAEMTLEEKVSQMVEESPAIGRLGIPAYNWWNEILHGVARTEYPVTVFPQAIGMAAGFDRDAILKMGDIASTEARAIYNEQCRKEEYGKQYYGLTFWTPNVNIFRDPRWGRGQETYGEDPYLTGELGKAIVTGLEGTDDKYLKVSACAKHYAVHSGPESKRHYFNARPNPVDLWNTYLPAFEKLVTDAKVSSVMCAYNSFDGSPCCGSSTLMMDILRNRWGFDGYVVSDCGAISDFWRSHDSDPDKAQASARAVRNGTDLECGEYWARLWTYEDLDKAVEDGLIDESAIDESLVRLFEIRMRLGMFDDPEKVPYSSIHIDTLNADVHKKHALKMARQSMVLLKNNGILPLSENYAEIAVVGPNANDSLVLLGNYNGFPEEAITPYEGIKAATDADVIYTKATGHTSSFNLDEELKKIRNADVVIFVGGISAMLEGEQGCIEPAPGFDGGDRTTIVLPEVQTEFMWRVKQMGKKLIFVNMSGGAMAMNWESENADAIIQAWYPGQAGGEALADIIFGRYNPSGRLPVTFYASDSDLPDFEDYSMAGRTYRYFTGKPLYEFGYGLSYTDFTYSPLLISRDKDAIEVSVKVTNSGAMDGDEVVQLYISPGFTDPRLPKRSLRQFERISLSAGETKEVRFALGTDDFSVYDENGVRFCVNGEYQVSVGGCQPSDEMAACHKVSTGTVVM